MHPDNLTVVNCTQGGCGNPVLSALFFCSFTVIITMILLNLFTAVVLENFEIQEEQAEWTLTPSALEVQNCRRCDCGSNGCDSEVPLMSILLFQMQL